MNVIQLVKEAHENAKSKGWWEETRTYGELIALIHSEVSEALEDVRAGKGPNEVWYEFGSEVIQKSVSPECKPCGIPSELADVCIRIFDLVGHYNRAVILAQGIKINADYDEGEDAELDWGKDASLPEKLNWLHAHLSASFGSMDMGYPDSAFHRLGDVVYCIQLIASDYGIDLDQAIDEKMLYNATRPYRHNNKVL